MNNITVVICMYNAEKFIIETLESLYNQKLTDFNLIILDDASKDSSVKVSNDFIKANNWINTKVIRFEKNRGLAQLRNEAVNICETEFLFFNDADDIAHNNMLEKLYTKITSDEKINVVSCYARYIDEESKPLPGGLFFGPKTKEEFFSRCKENKFIWMNAASMFRIKAARKVGGWNLKGFPQDSDIRYQDLAEDVDMYNRIADLYKDGEYMITLPEILRDYRKNPFSLSSGKRNTIALQNRLRHVKANIIRRRNNLEELTFLEYIKSQSFIEKIKFKLIDNSAYHYKLAGMNYMEKKYLNFIINIGISIVLNPSYIVMKIKNNNIRKSNGN